MVNVSEEKIKHFRNDFCSCSLESIGSPSLTVTMRTLACRLALWRIKYQIISMNLKVSPATKIFCFNFHYVGLVSPVSFVPEILEERTFGKPWLVPCNLFHGV